MFVANYFSTTQQKGTRLTQFFASLRLYFFQNASNLQIKKNERMNEQKRVTVELFSHLDEGLEKFVCHGNVIIGQM